MEQKFLICAIIAAFRLAAVATAAEFSEETISEGYNLTLKNYTRAVQGHVLSYEFFDFVENYGEKFDLNDMKCLADLKELSSAVSAGQTWALSVIDAWGTLPAGILYGSNTDLGNYDECLGINHALSESSQLKGKYCMIKLPIGLLTNVENLRQFLLLQIASCVPASCKATQIDLILKKFLAKLFELDEINPDITLVEEKNCSLDGATEPLSAAAIALITLLSILLALVLVSTLCDYFATNAPLNPLLKVFSARANARQLFRIVDYGANPHVIGCLNGIRCLSLVWVIFSHCFVMQLQLPNINNATLLTWAASTFSALITEGFFSVDTFFFLSGLLLAMVSLREMDKTSGKLNIPLMYLHRYLRLTPVVAFGILMFLTMKYFTDGPLWNSVGWQMYASCEETWWATLLYVQNYVYPLRMCVGHTWYLAVDMQLYIISPILLISLWKWGKKALIGIFTLLLLMWACLFSIVMLHGYTMFFKDTTNRLTSMKYIYFPTHVRTSPWLLGLMFGYYLHIIKGQRVKLSKYLVCLGWLICFALIGTSIFCLLPKSQVDATPLTNLEKALFLSFSRIAWPLALCWLVFACVQGYAGPINSFLAAPLWQPFARLSYCMYIFHNIAINTHGGSTRTNTNFSNYDLMLRFWADYGFTIILCVFMYLLVEAPFTNLEQFLMPKKKKISKASSQDPVLPAMEINVNENQILARSTNNLS